MVPKTVSRLPLSLAPRGLSRVQAAEYIGIGVTKFDEMVDDARMPRPKRIDGRLVWDRIKLDEAFDALDDDAALKNEWDDLRCKFGCATRAVFATIDFSSRMSTGTAMCEFISGAKGGRRSGSERCPAPMRLTKNISVRSAAS